MISLLMITFLIITPITSLDSCAEFRSQQSCILSQDNQCVWDSGYCQYTKNLELGCSNMLNKMACVKQLAFPSGEYARCVFEKFCHRVKDLSLIQCNDQISKYACQQINNIDQLCYWNPTNYTCNYIKEETYQNDFQDIQYSVSVCSRINNYLVIHSSLLWPLISYTPDFASEAQDIYRIDNGLQKLTADKIYENDLPANNKQYTLCDGLVNYFQWYHKNDATNYDIKYIKLSDRQREGCIAIQIENDDDYDLIFKDKINDIGINHIYCRYQGGIFTNNRCIYYDNELKLTQNNYLIENEIVCEQLSSYQCSFIQQDCYPILKHGKNDQEYGCAYTLDELKLKQGCLSQIQVYQTYKDCIAITTLNVGVFLDISQNPPKCDSSCVQSQQNDCNLNICKWIESEQDYYGCLPQYGCEQPGVNQYYCTYMYQLCNWDIINQRCYYIQDYKLNILLCNDAQQKYLCSQIRTIGQECIWIDEDNICLNVLSVPFFKKFESFPQKYSVNRILCMNTKLPSIYIKTKCIINTIEQNINSQQLNQFNKILCLQTEKCYWDIMKQQCYKYIIQNTCEQMINVSSDGCKHFIDCIYDSINYKCISTTINISCDSIGISQQKCLQLNNYPCQWIMNQCKQVTYFTEFCGSYNLVTKKVCILQENDKCYYQDNQCKLLYDQPINCLDIYNKYSCQYSKDKCYFFNEQCQNYNNQEVLCEGYYLSQKACINLKTKGQECIWDNEQGKCRYLNQKISCIQTQYQINKWSCLGIKSDKSAYLDKQYYCQYDSTNNQCNLMNISMPAVECGDQLFINQHICNGYANGKCIYENYQCQKIDDTHKYWYDKLGTVNCEQVSLSLCLKVRNRTCQWIDRVIGRETDRRCGEVTIYNIKCDLVPINVFSYLTFQYYYKETYNAQVCSQMQYQNLVEKCKRKPLTDLCEIPSNSLYFTCDELGLNKAACVMSTYGQCAFVQNVCINVQNTSLDCQILNQWACINSQNICQLSSDYGLNKDLSTSTITDNICQSITLTNQNISFSSDTNSWTSCSSNENYYGRLGQCIMLPINDISLTKCDSPGVSKNVCLKSMMLCQFKQNKCQNIYKRKCEYEDNIEDCVSNLYYNCVYQNNQCYTQDLFVKCNQYQYTNLLFCKQYSNCQYDYTQNNCIDLSIYMDIQNNYITYSNIDCTKYLNQFDCLNQWKTICQYQNNLCINPITLPTSCPHLEQYSKMICYQFDNCDFQYSYYCLDTTVTVSCSDLTENLCLADIDNSLTCYWDGTNCQSITNQICTNVQTYQMNYAGCKKVSDQDNQKCFYQRSSQKCKILQETNTCASFTTNIECALRANVSCLLGNPASATTTCTSSSSFNVNLNQYGCTQLTGTAYYYDIYTYTCVAIDLKKIQGCSNLNKDACTKSTSDALVIQCGWINNQCQQLKDLTSITDCTILNKHACINIEISTLTCQWNVAAKTCTLSTQNACYVPGSIPLTPTIIYSLSLCSKGSNTIICQANYNQSGCITFQYEVDKCSGLGLNYKACIEQTTDYCKWENSQCQISQFDNKICNIDVNQKTCLLLNNQLCTWNIVTKKCLDKILVECVDAINYNQCMNVPNKLCEFKDVCKQLNNQPIICEQGYNKLACQQVKFQTCQFINNTCSIIQYNNYWQICIQYITEQTCIINNYCEWQDNICIQQTQCNIDQIYQQQDLPQQLNDCQDLQPSACIQIYNKYACIYSNLYCQWDDILGCKSFITSLQYIQCDSNIKLNQKVCDKFAPQFCQFKDDTCSSQISQYYFNQYPSITLASSILVDHNIDQLNCNEYLDQQNCLWSTNQECYWDITCQLIDNNTIITLIENLNLLGCIKYNYQWRERKCYNQLYKFEPNNIMEIVNNCDTPFISLETCLNIQNEPCYFDTTINKCQQITQFDDICNAYHNVNKKTCQLLTNYLCDYNNISKTCITFEITTTIIDLNSISRKACISQEIAAYWNDGCYLAINYQCDQGYQSTPNACTQASTPCVYDKFNGICSSIYNINSLTCDSPGINYDVCTSIIREPCIFKDNKCQKIDLNLSCNQALRVNELACSSLLQSCKYDIVNKKCIVVTLSQLCSTQGLSKNACKINNSCIFNNDLMKCECSIIATQQPCHLLNINNCKNNSICYYDNDLNKCRRKICEDLSKQNCVGTLLNKYCYINQIQCQSANKCEDIININSNFCQTILFDGIPCLGSGNRCYSWNNYEDYCPNSNCNSPYCKLNDNKICQPIKCSELNECSDLGNKCIINNDGICQENNSCYLLDQLQCSGSTVSTQAQCYFSKYNIYQENLVCTSQVCQLYGNSDLCDGNESNGYTCLLVNNQCQPCEQIIDACICAEALGICIWDNNQCQSFQCNQFETKSACAVISRCKWNELDNKCLLHCNKIISAEDCNKRTNDCYYDEDINFCKSGIYTVPSLTIDLIITSVYSQIQLVIILIILIIV